MSSFALNTPTTNIAYPGYGTATQSQAKFLINDPDYLQTLNERAKLDLAREQAFFNSQNMQIAGLGMGLANLGLNIGMYGPQKKALKAQTDALKTDTALKVQERNRINADRARLNSAYGGM